MPQQHSLQSLALALTLSLAVGAAHAAADDPAGAQGAAPAAQDGKGKALVDEHCIKCHGTEVYIRPDRKVTSRDGLDRQVRRCETALELTWFDEDVADVAGYLNRQYYHFK